MKGVFGLCLTLACWVLFAGVACALEGVDRQDLQQRGARHRDRNMQSEAKYEYSPAERMRAYFNHITAQRIGRSSAALSGASQEKNTGAPNTAGRIYSRSMSDPYYESRAFLFSLPLHDRELLLTVYSLRQSRFSPPSGASSSPTGQESGESGQYSLLGTSYSLALAPPLQLQGELLHTRQSQEQGGRDYQTWRADMGLAYATNPAIAHVWGMYALSAPKEANTEDPLHPLQDTPQYSLDGPLSPGAGWTGEGPGSSSLARELMRSKIRSDSSPGRWQLGLGVRGISYLDRWESSFGLAYGRGLYEPDLPKDSRKGLSRRDSYIEARMEHRYQAYESLAAVLELGYASLDLDPEVWGENRDESGYMMSLKYDLSF